MLNRRYPFTWLAFLKRWSLPAVLCVSFMLGAASAQDGKNTLQAIKTSTEQGGKIVVRMDFQAPLAAVPPGFTVTNPARIALDLPNTANGVGKNSIDGEGDLRSINIVEVANRTRLVLNLARSLNYTTKLEGNALLLTIDATPAAVLKENIQVTKFAEAAPTGAAQTQSVRDVDFRRGVNGEGRVVVDLSSPNVGIDIRQQGKNVVVDFLNTTVPRNLVRRLDVLDFATPVRTIEVLDQGATTRMVIEPKGAWEYSAYQTDNKFIVEVKVLKEDPNKLVQGSGYAGEKLNLNFQSIEVRALLQVLADFTGLNIVVSDTVAGTVTLRLKDVPWDQALDIVLQSKGLQKRKNGNVVIIAPADELATKEKLALEASQQIIELEPMRTERFELSYAKAADVKSLLSDKDQKILSKRGSAVVDTRTNTVFVQDVPTRLDDVRRLISQLDIPVRQVMIEARIVIADDKWGRDVGSRIGFAAGSSGGGRNVGVTSNATNAQAIAQGGSPAANAPLAVNLPAAGGGSIGVSILNLANNNLLDLELSALETEGRGKVVSNPRIVAPDKKKATITQGTDIPYATQASSGGTTISFKSAVLSLAVTPQITPDDKIIMDIEIKKDAIGQVFAGVPSVDTRTLTTQVVVDNGDTAVLGGIYEQTVRTDVTKIPLLGDIPLIGNFFKRTQKQNDKTELLIFITPRIIKEQLTIR
jgi:type IV pilus assembly protein PilQ